MTTVWLDRNAGLCGGVRRALAGALQAARRNVHPVVSYGELVHNPQALGELRAAGIVESEDLTGLRGDELVVIRSHGIPPQEQKALERRGLACLDLTCPRVKKAQRLAAAAAARGTLLVVGNAQHPEVRGLVGYGGADVRVLAGPEQAAAYRGPARVALLAQTTIPSELFEEVAAELERRGVRVQRLNTLCPFVSQRQAWIDRYARRAGAALILGGRNSSNTRALYDTARRHGPAYWIAQPCEVDLPALLRHERLALTAGASTPDGSLADLVARLRAAGARVQRR